MPRAEALQRIAQVSGVSVDWLLSLENAREGRQEVAESVQIEKAVQADGSTPLDQWRSAASGRRVIAMAGVAAIALGIGAQLAILCTAHCADCDQRLGWQAGIRMHPVAV